MVSIRVRSPPLTVYPPLFSYEISNPPQDFSPLNNQMTAKWPYLEVLHNIIEEVLLNKNTFIAFHLIKIMLSYEVPKYIGNINRRLSLLVLDKSKRQYLFLGATPRMGVDSSRALNCVSFASQSILIQEECTVFVFTSKIKVSIFY